jgi:hypothetical protein
LFVLGVAKVGLRVSIGEVFLVEVDGEERFEDISDL